MTASPAHSPHIQMNPNLDRIVEAVLLLVHEAAKRETAITQYDIVKTVFIADKLHLNEFGRPITYDNYVAMKHGPVPSFTYDLLKENRSALRKYGKKLPWHRRAAPELGPKCFSFERPTREVSEDNLSPSDIDKLLRAFTVVMTLGFIQIRKLTHDDPAYAAAWRDEGERNQYPMNYSMLFDEPDEKQAAALSFASKHL